VQGKKILIVDDDPEMLKLARLVFDRADAEVYTALGGPEGLRQVSLCQPDLVILDVMMPVLDGWETCERIRRFSNVPIIFLTVLGAEQDILRGFDLGAVDYVTKPFSPKILLARAEAVFRQQELDRAAQDPSVYDDGHLRIDLRRRQVLVGGERVKLTSTEYRLLVYLYQNAGRVLGTEQILEHVWGWAYRDSVNYVYVYVRRLRQKIEPDPTHPAYLRTERGVGYSFETPTLTGEG
jgi:DNA-binding response OmpR family regulator